MIVNDFSSIGSHLFHKAFEAVKTDQVYYLAPVALCACTSLGALSHGTTAAFGRDSLSHRYIIFKESFTKKELTFFQRTQNIFHSVFGSIALKQRLYEIGISALYTTASLTILYALHAFINEPLMNEEDSNLDPAAKELYQEVHSQQIRENVLNKVRGHLAFFEAQLEKSHSAEYDPNLKLALNFADRILLPNPTPMQKILNRVSSVFCEFKNLMGFSSSCLPNPSVENMTVDQLHQSFLKIKNAYHEQIQPGLFQKVSNKLQDWCKTFFEATDCDNLFENFRDHNQERLKRDLGLIEFFYHKTANRALLSGRSQCQDSEEAVSLCREYITQKVGESVEGFSVKDLSSETLSSIFEHFKSEFAQYAKSFQLNQQSKDPNDAPALDELAKWIDNQIDLLKDTEESQENKIKSIQLLKETASRFFQISADFSYEAFKKAFNKFSRTYTCDKPTSSSDTCQQVTQIATSLRSAFRLKNKSSYNLGSLQWFSSDTSHSIGVLHPTDIINNLWNEFKKWYNTPAGPIEF